MGVEPTRQRMAPPTGFEARPIHQDRFPSSSDVGEMLNKTCVNGVSTASGGSPFVEKPANPSGAMARRHETCPAPLLR